MNYKVEQKSGVIPVGQVHGPTNSTSSLQRRAARAGGHSQTFVAKSQSLPILKRLIIGCE